MPSEIKQLNSIEQHAHNMPHAEQTGKTLSFISQEEKEMTSKLWDLHQKCSVRFNEISQSIQTTLRSSYFLHPNLSSISLASLSSAMPVKLAAATAATALVAFVAVPRIYNAAPELLKNLSFFDRTTGSYIPRDHLSKACSDGGSLCNVQIFAPDPTFTLPTGTPIAVDLDPFDAVENFIPEPTPSPPRSSKYGIESRITRELKSPSSEGNPPSPPPYSPLSQVVSTESNILDSAIGAAAYLASIAGAAVILGAGGQFKRQMPQFDRIITKAKRIFTPDTSSIKRFLKTIGGAFSASFFSTGHQRHHQGRPMSRAAAGSSSGSTHARDTAGARSAPSTVCSYLLTGSGRSPANAKTVLLGGARPLPSSSPLPQPPQGDAGRKTTGFGATPRKRHRSKTSVARQLTEGGATSRRDLEIYPSAGQAEPASSSSSLPQPPQGDARSQTEGPWVTPRKPIPSQQSVARRKAPDESSTSNYWQELQEPAESTEQPDSTDPKGSSSHSGSPTPPPPLPPRPIKHSSTTSSESSSPTGGAPPPQSSLLVSLQTQREQLKRAHKDGTPRKNTQRAGRRRGFGGNSRMIAAARANGHSTATEHSDGSAADDWD